MKKTLTTYDIAHELLDDSNANWSRAGAFALAEWLEELEESTGESMELDVVAIRCDFSESESLEEWAEQHTGKSDFWKDLGIDLEGNEDDEEKEELIRSYINDHGQLIEFYGGIIVSCF